MKITDWGKSKGVDVQWDPNQNMVNIGNLSFTPGQGSQYGIGGTSSQHTVTNEQMLMQALGMASPTDQQQPAGQQGLPGLSYGPTGMPKPPDPTNYIQQMYESSRNNLLSQIQLGLSNKLSSLQGEKDTLAPQFKQERVHADTTAIQAGQRLKEVLASIGQRGGENVTAQMGVEANRQGRYSDIGQREIAAHTDIARRSTQAQMSAEEEAMGIHHSTESELARALLTAQQDNYQNEYRAFQDRFSNDLSLRQTQLQENEAAWRKNANNPEVQRTLIQNRMLLLEEKNLPDELQMRKDKLQLEIDQGKVDIKISEAKLTEIEKEAEEEEFDADQFSADVYNDIDYLINKGEDPIAFLNESAEQIRNLVGHAEYMKMLKYAQETYVPPAPEAPWWKFWDGWGK